LIRTDKRDTTINKIDKSRKILHKMLIFDKNLRPKPRTKIIPLFNEIKFNISLKVSTLVFGTSIYKHINLRKPKNSTRRPEPKNIKT